MDLIGVSSPKLQNTFNMDYSIGQKWQDLYLSNLRLGRSFKVTKVKPVLGGYIVHAMDDYITLYYYRIFEYPDGSAKVRARIERNYQPTRRTTFYYTPEGRVIAPPRKAWHIWATLTGKI